MPASHGVVAEAPAAHQLPAGHTTQLECPPAGVDQAVQQLKGVQYGHCIQEQCDAALLTEANRDGDRFELQVGDDAFACDAHGAEVDAFSVGAAEAAGIDAGDGVWIVATTNGLAAVRG